MDALHGVAHEQIGMRVVAAALFRDCRLDHGGILSHELRGGVEGEQARSPTLAQFATVEPGYNAPCSDMTHNNDLLSLAERWLECQPNGPVQVLFHGLRTPSIAASFMHPLVRAAVNKNTHERCGITRAETQLAAAARRRPWR